jgi:hypothetical protein
MDQRWYETETYNDIDVSSTLIEQSKREANHVQTNTNLFQIEFVPFSLPREDDNNPQSAWFRFELNLRGFISTETTVYPPT